MFTLTKRQLSIMITSVIVACLIFILPQETSAQFGGFGSQRGGYGQGFRNFNYHPMMAHMGLQRGRGGFGGGFSPFGMFLRQNSSS